MAERVPRSTARKHGYALRTLFPETWRCVLYFLVLASALSLMALVSIHSGNSGKPHWWPMSWAAVAAICTAGAGTQLCLAVDRMLALRLPRIGSLLRDAVGLLLALSVGLPMLVMLLWQPEQAGGASSLPALAAALWLGSTSGLLLLSLPLPLAFLPGLLLILGWDGLDGPAAHFSAGCAALLLAGLSWHWHAARRRHLLLAPFGVWLEDTSQQLRAVERWPGPTPGGRRPEGGTARAGATAGRTPLVDILGQDFRTLDQHYGSRGRWLVLLTLAAILAAVLAYGHFGDVERTSSPSSNMIMFVISWGSMFLLMQRPGMALRALRKRLHAQRAELFLAPGLPPRPHLEQAVMRQVFLCLRERVLFLAIALPASMQLAYSLNPWWGLWWASFAVLSLLLGLYSAWLAWNGQQHGHAWLITFGILGIATHWWLLAHPHAPPAWLILAWIFFLLWTLTRFALARRRSGLR